MGIERCISSDQSGNEFLQDYRKENVGKVGASHFFEAIKSKRKLNHLMGSYLKDHINDELSQIEEFKKWRFVAGDGHYHKAAIFNPKTKADTSRKDLSKTPTGRFFSLDFYTPITFTP